MHTEQVNVYDKIVEILRDVAKVPADQIAPEKRIEEDLSIDSLAMVEVAVAAEMRLGVSVPDERAAEFFTVGDIVDFVGAALAATRG